VETHYQRRLVAFRSALQQICLTVGHLNGIRPRLDQRVDDARHVLQPYEEARLVADAVINGNVEAAAVIEQPVHPGLRAYSHCMLPTHERRSSASRETP